MPSDSAPAIDVQPNHLALVREILKRHVPSREVWVFGSRVTGKAKKASDLDLAIIGIQPLEFDTFTRLVEAFSESSLPWKVDVVDWATTSENFREIIRANHAVLQRP